MINEEQLLEIVDGILTTYNKLESLSDPVRRIAANDSAKRMYDFYDLLPKRRPFLFTVIAYHKDDTFINTELFYLEPREEPKDFLQRAYEYIRNLHGEGCIISKQEIKL